MTDYASRGSRYWSRRVTRRTALRGAGLGVAGLAGAALVGCGGGGEEEQGQQLQGQIQQERPGARATADPNATPVPASEVRLKPGIYDQPVAPSPAELNPAVNAKRGGILQMLYLDPPRMDINRTLSCTIYHTMDYTNSKLVRGKTGPLADPFVVEIEPDLAESWEANPDNTEFTFHLRKGIKTHNVPPTNGREYTSEDVRLSIERYRKGGTQQDVWSPVTSVETPDAYTIKLTLNQPLADFPTNISSWSFMWVKELIENEDLLQQRAVGTGPFIQEEWVQKERSRFRKHPEYFEQGQPYVDGIITYVQSDTATLRAGFQTNNFFYWSARDDLDAEDMSRKTNDMVLWKYPISRGANVNGWHFQIKNPAFQDERVRRAVSLAFDRNDYDLARNAGDNQNPNGAFSNPPMPWALLFDEYPDQRANGRWYQFDPAEARRLIQAAGYSADRPLTWEHVTWYDREPSAQVVIPGIMANLPEVRISFRQVDNPTQVTLLSDRNFNDTIGIVWGPPGHSMDQWVFPWYHTQGSLNYNAKGNAELDALLVQARREPNIEAKRPIWRQIWDTIHDQVWDFWWPEALQRQAWHNYLLNYRPHGWMGTYTCYVSNQARALWLDEGAPGR